MLSVDTLLLVISFICFLLATFGVPAVVNLVALGLALAVLTVLTP